MRGVATDEMNELGLSFHEFLKAITWANKPAATDLCSTSYVDLLLHLALYYHINIPAFY